ncbi:NAD(P)/FAD-dependent oxidoreductase [Acidiphilium iwatense]|uniref:FAD-binding oxidoreductase n=1 Tax=Acidiphilium iwatense TaxID=768198 RepID=A0ABS9E0G6_9PROT|nr:FAD-binding oxidoreductase [Acidiphilium iwatense]MCF3948433.1 FAD-binding oxidoreductase [Acidiphilium iwatense]
MALSNYYEATARLPATTASLKGDIRCDVAVLGAGMTGCSAALHLAERGYRVAVLEAERIGFGASGRNGGQALPGFAADQVKVRRIMGEAVAKRLWDLSMEAVDLLHAQITRFAIPCDPKRGYLHVAVKDRQVRELEAWIDELEALGTPGFALLRGAELQSRLPSPRYKAALYDPVAGHIHPLNYTLGLGHAAIAAGAQIFTGTRVQKIEPGNGVRLKTPGGTVTADFLLICGNAYLGDLVRPIAGYVMPVGTYIVATEPRDDIPLLIPGNEAVADLNFVLDYFRRSADNRMLFGGRVSYSTLPPPNLAASMLARARRAFPQLADARADYAWGGNVAITHNRLPHFGRLGRNILFAQGFSGHGVALTGFTGKLLAEAVAGQAERFDVFTRIPHARFPGGSLLRMPTLVLATSWFRLRDML